MKNVEWGEFRFLDVFDHIAQGRRLKKDDQMPGTIPFVMAGTSNTGVVGYISNPVTMFPGNSITADIFGNVFYRDYKFGAGDDTGVYWNESKCYSKNSMMFISVAMKTALRGKYSYGDKLRSSQSLGLKLKLPIKDGKQDFDFMDKYIAELEAVRIAELEVQRITELEAYLTVSGLADYVLTETEQETLDNYDFLCWQEYNLEQLFGKSTRGKRLKGDDRISGTLPFVTAGETDEGISAFIGNDVQVFSKNTTTIDMFGSAKYRNYCYGGDDHVAVVHTEKLPMDAAIFVTAAIHKSAHNGQFNYGHNFYAKDADALNILLPSKDGNPDYETMAALISAVRKMVIKGVVEYADERIELTKKAIEK